MTTFLVVVTIVVVAAVIALVVYKIRHPEGYAEHKQEAKDVVDAVKKPFDKP